MHFSGPTPLADRCSVSLSPEQKDRWFTPTFQGEGSHTVNVWFSKDQQG